MHTNLEQVIREKFARLSLAMNEATTRLWAAAEARCIGRGGVAVVSRATGLSVNTIRAGMLDLEDPAQQVRLAAGQIRRLGGGRKPLTVKQPGLAAALDALVSPVTRGDPMSPLRWSSKSTEKLAAELNAEGFSVSADTVGNMLKAQHYSLQSTRKKMEGGDHPDRDAQFQHIADEVRRMQAANQPVISVDCKKKELIGEFKNGGKEWQPAGMPTEVNVYDFPDQANGKAIPYGVYDITRNEGWVSVGIDHDTAEFAVATIAQWWQRMGNPRYKNATELYITADGGGSNGARNRLWKLELQHFADRTGLTIQVSHLPPGTSKWNKIEHRLFGQITTNWRGKPLVSLQTVVSLIGATSTKTGLQVKAAADLNNYATGRTVTDDQVAALALNRNTFHGDWNYTISPRRSAPTK